MNVHVEIIGPSRKQICVEVPSSQVDEAFQGAFTSYQKGARIPGFRPGKAPVQLIKSRYQKDIASDVKDFLLPRNYHQAIQQEKIAVETVINVEAEAPVEGKPYAFTVTVDVVPDFPLPDYKTIRVESKAVEVGEKDVDNVIDNIRSRMATFEDEEGRVAEKGDQVVVNYTGTIEGKPISEWTKVSDVLSAATELPVVLDEERFFLVEFVKELVGVSAGTKKTIQTKFDDQFVEKSLAGKQAIYEVEVVKVQRRVLPEITEEFVKSMGSESIDVLRDRIRKDITMMRTSEERRRLEGAVAAKLLEMTAMTLPQSQVQRQTANEVYELVQHNTRMGLARESIEENREQIFSAAAKTAEDRLKLRYILMKIANAEDFSVSDFEVEQHIRQLAARAHKDPVKLKAEFKRDGVMDDVQIDILVSKAMKQLVDMQLPAPVAA